MFFDQPQVLHSTEGGRHWFTTMDFPPLQVMPVAPNLCRAGLLLARMVAARLAKGDGDIPAELPLKPEDLAAIVGRANVASSPGARPVTVAIEMKPGPESLSADDEEEDDDVLFVTPVPSKEWQGTYDEWVVSVIRSLGVHVPDPAGRETYEAAMAAAMDEARKRIPSLRERFLSGMDGLNLGFKLGLPTGSGRMEYVWLTALDWSNPEVVLTRLENQPRGARGYRCGQELTVKVADLVDYTMGSEQAGSVDPGFTQQVAEDYGDLIV